MAHQQSHNIKVRAVNTANQELLAFSIQFQADIKTLNISQHMKTVNLTECAQFNTNKNTLRNMRIEYMMYKGKAMLYLRNRNWYTSKN